MYVIRLLQLIDKGLKSKVLKKTIVYRVISMVVEFLLSYIIIQRLIDSLLLTVTILLVNSIIYYSFEKLWK